MKLVKYPRYLCIWLFICIALILGGIAGIIWAATMDSNFYCKKIDSCIYYVVNYGCYDCQQCMILIPGQSCSPYPMDDDKCPNTTICYASNYDGCPLPNADSYPCTSLIPAICILLSAILLAFMLVSLIFIIYALYQNVFEYISLINKSTGVINESSV